MTTLADLKLQQNEIREISGALMGLMTHENQAVDTIAKVTHTLLCDLCKKLDLHLAEEHKGVYPELLSHGDQAVQNMVWGFINNDIPLRAELHAYKHKWLRNCEYAVSAAFIEETRQILAMLIERIELEGRKMMPKLEEAGLLAYA